MQTRKTKQKERHKCRKSKRGTQETCKFRKNNKIFTRKVSNVPREIAKKFQESSNWVRDARKFISARSSLLHQRRRNLL